MVAHICVDWFRRGHKYTPVVSDTTSGKVLYVGIGRTKKKGAEALVYGIEFRTAAGIQSVSIDM